MRLGAVFAVPAPVVPADEPTTLTTQWVALPHVKLPGPGSAIPDGEGIGELFQCAPPSVVTMNCAMALVGASDGALPMTAHISAVAQKNENGGPPPDMASGRGAVCCQLSPPLEVR